MWPFNLVRPLVDFYRLLAPFHVVHSYGVFGVSIPKKEFTGLVIEGTNTGTVWEQYKFKYFACDPNSVPKFFAPYQPRIDHQIFYEAIKQRTYNFNFLNPYNLNKHTWLDRMIQRLLEGSPEVLELLGNNPFPRQPPLLIRVSCYHYNYEKDSKKGWWQREFQYFHTNATTRSRTVFKLPEPSQFHKHNMVWRIRLGQDTLKNYVPCYWYKHISPAT